MWSGPKTMPKCRRWSLSTRYTGGLTQQTVAPAIDGAMGRLPDLPEWIPDKLMASRGWPDLADSDDGGSAPHDAAETCCRNHRPAAGGL